MDNPAEAAELVGMGGLGVLSICLVAAFVGFLIGRMRHDAPFGWAFATAASTPLLWAMAFDILNLFGAGGIAWIVGLGLASVLTLAGAGSSRVRVEE